MTDRVLSPYSPAVTDARPVARGTSRLCLLALVCAALLCLTQPATAQSNVPKLTGSDPIGSAEQGFSVAVSGDGNTAIVGGPFDNSGAGAAWVFTRSGGTWTQQQKLTADDCERSRRAGLVGRAVRRRQHRYRRRAGRQHLDRCGVGIHPQRQRVESAGRKTHRRRRSWGWMRTARRGWKRGARLLRCALGRRQHRHRGRLGRQRLARRGVGVQLAAAGCGTSRREAVRQRRYCQ